MMLGTARSTALLGGAFALTMTMAVPASAAPTALLGLTGPAGSFDCMNLSINPTIAEPGPGTVRYIVANGVVMALIPAEETRSRTPTTSSGSCRRI
jgi:hypothetical protein